MFMIVRFLSGLKDIFSTIILAALELYWTWVAGLAEQAIS